MRAAELSERHAEGWGDTPSRVRGQRIMLMVEPREKVPRALLLGPWSPRAPQQRPPPGSRRPPPRLPRRPRPAGPIRRRPQPCSSLWLEDTRDKPCSLHPKVRGSHNPTQHLCRDWRAPGPAVLRGGPQLGSGGARSVP